MLLEKYREEFTEPKGEVLLSFDRLPSPLGYFIELESDREDNLTYWEERFGLSLLPVAEMDYGEMVKNLDNGKRRVLVFEKISF